MEKRHHVGLSGTNVLFVSYDFFFPTQLSPVMSELEAKGFTCEGMLK